MSRLPCVIYHFQYLSANIRLLRMSNLTLILAANVRGENPAS